MKSFFNLSLYFISFFSLSQVDFNHSLGMTTIHGRSDEYVAGANTFSNAKSFVGLTYNPRLDYLLNDNLSVGLSLYPTFCTSFSKSTGAMIVNKRPIAIEVPLLFQINFGNHSSENSRSRFGGFIGAGINHGIYSIYHTADIQSTMYVLDNITLNSLCFQAGFTKNQQGKDIGLRFEYNIPLNNNNNLNFMIIGAGVFYDLYSVN